MRCIMDGDSFGEFMGNPVTLTTKGVYPIDNYGSAVPRSTRIWRCGSAVSC